MWFVGFCFLFLSFVFVSWMSLVCFWSCFSCFLVGFLVGMYRWVCVFLIL